MNGIYWPVFPNLRVKKEAPLLLNGLRRSLGTFPALQSSPFRQWWTGYFISTAGKQMLWMTEGWLIYELSGSKLLLGANSLAQAVPATALALVGGVLADRLDQRRLVMVVQMIDALVLFVMTALCFFRIVEVWHVILASFLHSSVSVFEQPARQSLFPHLVDREAMPSAIGLSSMVHPGTRVFSPVITGFILAGVMGATGSPMVAAGTVFAITGCGLAVYTVILGFLQVPPIARVRGGNVLSNTVEGMRFVWTNRIYASLISAVYVNMLFAHAMHVLFPVVAKDVLGMGPETLGMMSTSLGIGSLIGAMIGARWMAARNQGRWTVIGSLVVGASTILFGLSEWYPVTLAVLWISGVGSSIFSIAAQSSIQLMVPDAFRGRVMAMWGMTHSSVRPVGEMQFAGVAALTTASFALVLGGLVVIAFTLLIALPNRNLRRLNITEAHDARREGAGHRG
jgi:MFS family permease